MLPDLLVYSATIPKQKARTTKPFFFSLFLLHSQQAAGLHRLYKAGGRHRGPLVWAVLLRETKPSKFLRAKNLLGPGLDPKVTRGANSSEPRFTAMRLNSTLLNKYLPHIEVYPDTYTVKADGRGLRCEPASVLPMAQRYFLF
jgi:hypothetical protein